MRPIAIVSGALANKPNSGGNAWSRLQWLLGLNDLGFEVFFVEQLAETACVDAAGEPAGSAGSTNRAFFQQVCQRFSLTGHASLLGDDGEVLEGLGLAALEEAAADSELLVNIGGHLMAESIKSRPRRRIFFDDDPGYTQFWYADGLNRERLDGHDIYFTVGAHIGARGCSIPTGDIPWRPARPLVVLDEWPAVAAAAPNRFTTVASWRGAYGPVQHGTRMYGQKAHEFRRFAELPNHVSATFEIALDIHPAESKDLALLRENGWQLVNPRRVAASPDMYQRYLQASSAEFSAAQGIYVHTCSGWLSDRSIGYLASGKPVLVQDTGFSRNYPAGDGLVPFSTLAEAIDGADRIMRDYAGHCQAARALAETHFDSRRVLSDLLEQAQVRGSGFHLIGSHGS